MSADKRNVDATEDESLSSLILRALGRPERVAPQKNGQSDPDLLAQAAPGEEPNSYEAITNLLRAIEGSEIAERLQQGAAPIPLTEPPGPSEPAKSDAGAAASMLPMASPPADKPPEVAEPSAVQRRPLMTDYPRYEALAAETAPLQTGVPSEVQRRQLAPAHLHLLVPAAEEEWTANEGESSDSPIPFEVEPPQVPFFERFKAGLWRFARMIGVTAEVQGRIEEKLKEWHDFWIPPPPPEDPRRSDRLFNPPLVAFYWTGGAAKPRRIADISSTGVYMVTEDRWYLGTKVTMVLQRNDHRRGKPAVWIAVDVMIMRWGNDGVGGAFVLPNTGRAYEERMLRRLAHKETLQRFVNYLAVSAEDHARVGHAPIRPRQ